MEPLRIKCLENKTGADGSIYGKFVIEPLEKVMAPLLVMPLDEYYSLLLMVQPLLLSESKALLTNSPPFLALLKT
jgi:hypothetical protein